MKITYCSKGDSNDITSNHIGKNDHMRCATHRDAVFEAVMHSTFDMRHHGILWTCNLTRLLWYLCDYGHLILCIMLHSIKPPNTLHCMLSGKLENTLLVALECTLPACLTYTPKQALNTLRSTLLVYSQQHLKVCSLVHSHACYQGCTEMHLLAYSQSAWLTL